MKNIFENIKTETVYYPIILFKRVLIERKYLKIRICGYAPPFSSFNQKIFFLNIKTETVYCTIILKSCLNWKKILK